MRKQINSKKQNGFSILEVVIGIFIFMVGMLALAALQGALTRSMADSKLRTTAANIADRVIERQRGFTQLLTADTPGVPFAYNDIVTPATDETVDVNGVTYTIDMNVKDYYYQLSADTLNAYAFCTIGDTDCPTGATSSDYKQVAVTVNWGSDLDFRGDEGEVVTAATLGTGSITLTGVIPALITSASARVADESTGGAAAPHVIYNPGDRPDVVRVSLGDGIYKESTLPEPDVTTDDELIETRFDVITYSQTAAGGLAQFVRREEFAVVSCDCTLVGNGAGRRPVIWAGDEYVRGQFVQKTTGMSANNQQSSLCATCCRDHHDGGSDTGSSIEDHTDGSVNVYDPFNKPTNGTSDHDHYVRTGDGLAVATGDYVEACRLVRQDGFFRVAQDFRREDLNIFPADFFNDPGGDVEIQVYSTYIMGAIPAYVNAVGINYPSVAAHVPCIGPSGCVAIAPKQGIWDTPIEVNEMPSWTRLLNVVGVGASAQQLRSRGIYMDYLSDDLRMVLTNCTGTKTADDAECKFGDVELDRTGHVNPLELIPFFDVQMTKLNRWNEAPANIPVDTTNEPLESNNDHSRGIISKVSDGGSTVVSTGHRGNLGFTDSFPIDTLYSSLVTSSDIFVDAGSGYSAGGTAILGSLSHTLNGNPDIMVTGSVGVECGQTTVDYGCTVLSGASNPQIIISGYGKDGRIRYACSPLVPDSSGTITDGEFAEAAFNLSGVTAGTTYNFMIQEGVACS